MAMKQVANFSDEVTERRRSFRAKENQVDRRGWIVNS